jgi:hypothetical protein
LYWFTSMCVVSIKKPSWINVCFIVWFEFMIVKLQDVAVIKCSWSRNELSFSYNQVCYLLHFYIFHICTETKSEKIRLSKFLLEKNYLEGLCVEYNYLMGKYYDEYVANPLLKGCDKDSKGVFRNICRSVLTLLDKMCYIKVNQIHICALRRWNN